ncbi:ABC transporter permease [candidate division KSB1 bacterium]
MKKNSKKPPFFARSFLKTLINAYEHDSLIGDFDEMYTTILKKNNRLKADFWYWAQLFKALPTFVKNSFIWSLTMLKNYLKISLRNIKKNKLFTLINLSGLAIGIASVVVIALFIRDELSFDNFHDYGERIYRLEKNVTLPGRTMEQHAITSGKIAGAMVADFPEVDNAVKIFEWRRQLLVKDDKKYYIENVLTADENFFEIFSFKLLEGDPKTALKEPYCLVISEEYSRKFFPDENPMGKTLNIQGNIYMITGIVEDPPKNSHIQYSMIGSWSTILDQDWLNNWRTQCMYTYLLLDDNNNADVLQKKFPGFMKQYMSNRINVYSPYLKPLSKIHLHSSQTMYDLNWKKGNINNIYIFPIIALFILLIGCINFMNLSTARSAKRAKEVGMRKVAGAYRSSLVKQFLSESIILAFIAMMTAVIISKLILPAFNNFSGKELSLGFENALPVLLLLFVVTLFVGLISGSYPAFFLSSFQPSSVFKGNLKTDLKNKILRKGLVIFQFIISIVLISGTLIVYKQLNYINKKDLGFNKDHVVILNNNLRRLVDKYESFRSKLISYPEITDVTGSRHIMGEDYNTYTVLPEGTTEDENWIVACIPIDYNFIPFMDMELIKGRNFSKEHGSDLTTSIIINETMAKKLGWEIPLNKRIDITRDRPDVFYESRVIGVVKDFHIKSLHHKFEPVIFLIHPEWMQRISIRISPQNIRGTLGQIETLWKEFDPDNPFEYSFLDENFDKFYKSETNLGKIFSYFTILTIFIACMGLFGLVSFTAEQKTKEIGIRKVLGASVSGLMVLLSGEFIKLIILANIIALPIGYYFVNRWLQNFAYKTHLGIMPFVLAGLSAIFVALLTVTYQTVKAAYKNPVDSLKDE